MNNTLDRSQAPIIRPIKKVELLAAEQITLANNIPLYTIRGGDQPVVQLELWFPAGRAFETKKLLAQITARALKEGTTRHSAQEIAEMIDYHGAHIEAAAYYDWASISLVCLTKHLPAMLPLMKELMTSSTFAQSELDILKQRNIQKLRINEEKSDYLAQRAFHNHLFGEEHYYGYASSVERYNAINSVDTKGFYDEKIKGKLTFALACGDVNTNVIAAIKSMLEQEVFSYQTYKAPNLPLTTSPGAYYNEIDDAQQSSIRIGKEWPAFKSDVSAPLNVLNTILGGYFGSRLMKNIREDKGYTYGIYSSYGAFHEASYWMIGTDVGKTVKDDALTQIYKEIELLRTELVSNDELQLVKNYMMGVYLSRVDGPFAQAKMNKNLISRGETVQDFQERIEQTLAVTPQQILETAQKYMSVDDVVEVVVG